MSANTDTPAPTAELADLKIENGNNGVPASTTSPAPSSPAPSSPAPKSPASNSPAPTAGSFRDSFKAFSKFGDTKSDGKHITLSQSDKWMKQAKVIDGKKITTTDTGIYFKKLKTMKVAYDDYQKFLEDLAKNKKVDVAEIKSKMASCSQPGLTGVGVPKTPSAVDRLTDVSKYTGSHKQRFTETGKGKGIAGRKDLVDGSGYVSGYQNKDTYTKTH